MTAPHDDHDFEILDLLQPIDERYAFLSEKIRDPEVINNDPGYKEYLKEYGRIEPAASRYRELMEIRKRLNDCREMIENEEDDEMVELAEQELEELLGRGKSVEKQLKTSMLSQDPDASKNVILEIRAGVGGEEAALFAADIYKMYSWFAEKMKWKIEVLSENYTELGGIKEVVANISGRDVFGSLRYESGGHRVQRVPVTEAGGRIHTSAVTVAVMPEPDEIDVDIKKEDLEIEVMRSSGPGGQSVNTTDSAVRIRHIPTDVTVMCQDEKSQHKNKTKALKILRTRVYDKVKREKDAERSELRKSMVGSGDRSQRIRTYNFPQNRISDHRAGVDLFSLNEVLHGAMEELIQKLKEYFSEQIIKEAVSKYGT